MSTPEQELKCLLHFGRELPYYQPGDRVLEDFYHSCVHTVIENLMATEKLPDAANCIVKAFSDGYSAHPSMLVYALAVCVRQGLSMQLRESAYRAVKTVCSSPENLFLFIKYSAKLSQSSGIWGNGFRKVCKDWYMNKDVKVLAEMVGSRKVHHGWSHKDVIKLIHLKPDEPARGAVIKYVLFGIKAAKKEFGEYPEATEVLNYLQAIEDFRHSADEQLAARNAELHHFTLDHVPVHLLKSKEVWGALIQNLPLGTLLRSLEKLAHLGFLRSHVLLHKVLDVLKDENAIADSHLHPAQVYIALRNYETSAKMVAVEYAKKKRRTENGSGESKKVTKPPPKPNPKIVSAVHNVFTCACKLFLPPTGLRYCVTVDLKYCSMNDKCFRCPHVSPAQASAVTVLCLLHADRHVSVRMVRPNEEMVTLAVDSNMSVYETHKKFEEYTGNKMKFSTPLEWAIKHKEEFDVFVILSDMNHKATHVVANTIQTYRNEMKIPNAKVVVVLLKSPVEPPWLREVRDPGIFVIGGFDGNVPRLIEAFSRGAF